MEAVLWSILAVVVIGCAVVFLAWRRQRASVSRAWPMPAKATGDGAKVEVVKHLWQAPPTSISLPDIFELEVGASVGGDGAGRILGAVTYRESKYTWKEYFLTGGKWLGADKDEGDRLILWERQPASGLEPKGKAPLTFNGVHYGYEERGTATYSVRDDAGSLTGEGSMEYVDYVAPNGHYLSLERYDDDQDWEVSVGSLVPINAFRYTPPGQAVSETELR